ncbi:serine hydrolase domain-containing protein [Altererythrobacter sp. MF3-039]|uniref:serine hydrolase domain-containing protein n=1 Tax=Altererythrobacter sp. MF3-039 TaxID=3252901 RepID=UPI00390C9E45
MSAVVGKRILSGFLPLTIAAMAWVPAAAAQEAAPAPLDGRASDPAAMGWMEGSPPPEEKRVLARRSDHFIFPKTRWSFSHMREVLPTANIDIAERWELPRDLHAGFERIEVTPMGAQEALSFEDALYASYTDALLVMHEGEIIYERYLGVTKPDTRHIAFSVTKSFIGTIAESMIAEGRLDQDALVESYLPELAESGFAGASVRQVMDMTTDLDWSEVYSDPNSDIAAYSLALGIAGQEPPGYTGPRTIYDYLPTVKKGSEGHGTRFVYRTVNTDVLAWIVARVEGKPLNTILSERIWKPFGMECAADILVDPIGTPFVGGGLNLCLRDLARFGEAIRLGGRRGDGQILPEGLVEGMIRGAALIQDNPKANYATLPGYSYRSQWWFMNDDHGAFSARGIHGQAIWIDPQSEIVIARFGSHPIAGNVNIDPITLPTYRAIVDHVTRGD